MIRKAVPWVVVALLLNLCSLAVAQDRGELGDLVYPKSYKSMRVSSHDRSGRNDDGQGANRIRLGETRELAMLEGPGMITHIWVTISSSDERHLKKLVLRMYWDGEKSPSVEAPIGDFFGLGLGKYFHFESGPVMVATLNGLNCFWRMPFRKSARITVSYESEEDLDSMDPTAREALMKEKVIHAFYYYVDYQKHISLPDDLLYFHAQFHQEVPCEGYTDFYRDGQPEIDNAVNLDGDGNYLILEAEGRGHYVGVFHSLIQNQDEWWGEGDDMIFIDGSAAPVLNGTGSEDYYCGAWGFGDPYFYRYTGCNSPLEHGYERGAEWSVYRLHLESLIVFQKNIRVTMEHGHANHRSDNWYTCAFWYQTEPHKPFPALPPAKDRIVRKINLGGKGFHYRPEATQ